MTLTSLTGCVAAMGLACSVVVLTANAQLPGSSISGDTSQAGQPLEVTLSPIVAGAEKPEPATTEMGRRYSGQQDQIDAGGQLYLALNCVGCHFHGGGGMGPPLMDDKWIYGGRIDQIAASIMEGRPRGMPAWQGRLTEQQMWQLAAYVRSLSGQVRKDAIGARADEMSNTPPMTQMRREPIRKEVPTP
jgi:cytochrome c oxidase cbb3-type subunit 3